MKGKSKPLVFRGRARVIPQRDVDTDMIFHNRHLHITDPQEMKRHIFGNLPGWEQFPEETRPGDILFVGHNFGCGSSRQQAVEGIKTLGVAAIVGESFGAIYKRNAVNAGLPLSEAPGITTKLRDGETVEVDLEAGLIRRIDGGEAVSCTPLSGVQREIYFAGGLLELVADG